MKLALVICPQWSDITPSFALGSLTSHIDNSNVEVKQFDLNIGSSLYFLKLYHNNNKCFLTSKQINLILINILIVNN